MEKIAAIGEKSRLPGLGKTDLNFPKRGSVIIIRICTA